MLAADGQMADAGGRWLMFVADGRMADAAGGWTGWQAAGRGESGRMGFGLFPCMPKTVAWK